MAAIVQARANNILDATLGTASLTAFTGAAKIRLTTTAPTATTAGTELTGTGYTTGGATIVFAAAASGATSNTGAVSWTNGSGSTWTVQGLEVWDSAGSPLRFWFGSFTGAPISVPNGAVLQIAASAITVALS
jgi:hypothetical protein